MFAFMKAWMSSKLGIVRSKTRSLGQTLNKPCEHSRGHIFGPIFNKLGENVDLHASLDVFETGSCSVKNKVTIIQIIEKALVNTLEAILLTLSTLKLVRVFVCM